MDQDIVAITTSSKEQRLSDYLRAMTFKLTPKEISMVGGCINLGVASEIESADDVLRSTKLARRSICVGSGRTSTLTVIEGRFVCRSV